MVLKKEFDKADLYDEKFLKNPGIFITYLYSLKLKLNLMVNKTIIKDNRQMYIMGPLLNSKVN